MNCVAVAEGQDSTGLSLTLAFTTFDGGESWVQSFTSNELGLAGAAFSSDGNVWMCGTALQGREMVGQFRVSVDRGKSFTLSQVAVYHVTFYDSHLVQ